MKRWIILLLILGAQTLAGCTDPETGGNESYPDTAAAPETEGPAVSFDCEIASATCIVLDNAEDARTGWDATPITDLKQSRLGTTLVLDKGRLAFQLITGDNASVVWYNLATGEQSRLTTRLDAGLPYPMGWNQDHLVIFDRTNGFRSLDGNEVVKAIGPAPGPEWVFEVWSNGHAVYGQQSAEYEPTTALKIISFNPLSETLLDLEGGTTLHSIQIVDGFAMLVTSANPGLALRRMNLETGNEALVAVLDAGMDAQVSATGRWLVEEPVSTTQVRFYTYNEARNELTDLGLPDPHHMIASHGEWLLYEATRGSKVGSHLAYNVATRELRSAFQPCSCTEESLGYWTSDGSNVIIRDYINQNGVRGPANLYLRSTEPRET